MKKSTIFVVILIYIVSVVVVGLFGISIKSYDPKVYVDDIKISVVADQGFNIVDNTDYNVKPISYDFATIYQKEMTVKLKASVEPANTSFPNVAVEYDTKQEVFTVEVVDKVYINVHFAEGGSAKFTVLSTDGKKVAHKVKVNALDI